MAQGRPWYKRNGGDFVMATLSMPDAETKWAYSAIIDMLNDRDRPLADEAPFICGFTGLTKQKWGRVRAYLIDHGYLTLTADKRLTNPRFDREAQERAEAHDLAVQKGREGGRKSAAMRAAGQGDLDLGESDKGEKLKETAHVSSKFSATKLEQTAEIEKQKPPKTANGAQPPPQASRARKRREARESESLPTTAVEAAPLDPLGLSEHLTRIAGVRNVEPARIIANKNIVGEWLTLGVAVADIEQTIRERRDKAEGATINSLRYFDPAIRQAKARKDHPNARDHNDPHAIADPLLRRYVEAGGSLGE